MRETHGDLVKATDELATACFMFMESNATFYVKKVARKAGRIVDAYKEDLEAAEVVSGEGRVQEDALVRLHDDKARHAECYERLHAAANFFYFGGNEFDGEGAGSYEGTRVGETRQAPEDGRRGSYGGGAGGAGTGGGGGGGGRASPHAAYMQKYLLPRTRSSSLVFDSEMVAVIRGHVQYLEANKLLTPEEVAKLRERVCVPEGGRPPDSRLVFALYQPVEILRNTFVQIERRCICTAAARVLTPAECMLRGFFCTGTTTTSRTSRRCSRSPRARVSARRARPSASSATTGGSRRWPSSTSTTAR